MMASFEKKPAKPNSVWGIPTPVSADVPINIIAKVKGMSFAQAAHLAHVLLVMHGVMTKPAARNSSALKKAWVKRWNMAAQ